MVIDRSVTTRDNTTLLVLSIEPPPLLLEATPVSPMPELAPSPLEVVAKPTGAGFGPPTWLVEAAASGRLRGILEVVATASPGVEACSAIMYGKAGL